MAKTGKGNQLECEEPSVRIKQLEDRLAEAEQLIHDCFNKMTGIDFYSWGDLRTKLADYKIKHDIF